MLQVGPDSRYVSPFRVGSVPPVVALEPLWGPAQEEVAKVGLCLPPNLGGEFENLKTLHLMERFVYQVAWTASPARGKRFTHQRGEVCPD